MKKMVTKIIVVKRVVILVKKRELYRIAKNVAQDSKEKNQVLSAINLGIRFALAHVQCHLTIKV